MRCFNWRDMLTVMVNGKVLATGAPAEIRANREVQDAYLGNLDDDAMNSPPVIEARGLHAYYGASHVLHGIDFSVSAGEAIALMGRNGMGKTTLIRSLVGHLPPRRGEIRVHGRRYDARLAPSDRQTGHRLRSRRPRHFS